MAKLEVIVLMAFAVLLTVIPCSAQQPSEADSSATGESGVGIGCTRASFVMDSSTAKRLSSVFCKDLLDHFPPLMGKNTLPRWPEHTDLSLRQQLQCARLSKRPISLIKPARLPGDGRKRARCRTRIHQRHWPSCERHDHHTRVESAMSQRQLHRHIQFYSQPLWVTQESPNCIMADDIRNRSVELTLFRRVQLSLHRVRDVQLLHPELHKQSG